MVAWTPELYNQYGPNNPMLQSFLDSDKSGNTSHDINDPSFGAGPSAPGGASALSNLLKNQASTATNIPSTMNSPPAPAIQQQALPNAQGWDFPQLPPQSGGEYHLPARTDMNQLTSYQSAFDTPVAQSLQRQMTEQSGAWNNPQLPGWAQAFARGITPYGVQLAAQGQDSKRQQAAASMLNDYTNARANDQQGLERNTAAYGNVGDAYAKQQMLLGQMRHIYFQGNQARDAGAASLASAAERLAKGQQTTQLTPELVNTQRTIQGRNQNEGLAAAARGGLDTERTTTEKGMRQGKLDKQQADIALEKARTGAVSAKGPGGAQSKEYAGAINAAAKQLAEYQHLLDYGVTISGKTKLEDIPITDENDEPIKEATTKGAIYGSNPDPEATAQAKRAAIKAKRDKLLQEFPQLKGAIAVVTSPGAREDKISDAPALSARKKNSVYNTPGNGPMKWTGTGWVKP